MGSSIYKNNFLIIILEVPLRQATCPNYVFPFSKILILNKLCMFKIKKKPVPSSIQLPKWFPIFLCPPHTSFDNFLNTSSVVWMCMWKRGSTGKWETYQWLHLQKEWFPITSYQLIMVPELKLDSRVYLPNCGNNLTDLIWHRSCADRYSFCEAMNVIAMLCTKDSTSL